MARRGTLIAYMRKETDSNAPVVPVSWDITHEDNGWFSVFPRGRQNFPDVYFHAKHMGSHATLPRACYVCVGTPVILQRLADLIASDALSWTRTWANLIELKADNTAVAVAIKSAWLDQVEGNPVVLSRMLGYQDDDGN